MTKTPIPNDDKDRLSPDEISALVVWLAESGRLGERPPDAVTVADIAEAYAVDPAEVARHLRVLRAERSFVAAPAKPKNQAGLLGLAAAMFVVAGLIYKLTPHKMTDEEADAMVQELKAKPHRIHYPVEKRFDLGDAAPPAGFTLELDGDYVIATAQAHGSRLLRTDEAAAQLTKSFEALADAAHKLEQDTPAPPAGTELNPPGVRVGQRINRTGGEFGQTFVNGRWVGGRPGPLGPGQYVVNGLTLNQPASPNYLPQRSLRMGGAVSDGPYGSQLAAPPSDPAGLALWRANLAASVRAGVELQLRQQNSIFDVMNKPQPDQWATAPPGFSLMYRGQTTMNLGGTSAYLLPIPVEPSVDMLVKAIRFAIRKDRDQMSSMPMTRAMRVAQEKKPAVPFAKVTLNSPAGAATDYQLPIERSTKFPTAADVIRGQDAVIKEMADRARSILEAINAGKEPAT